ncbi:hypothetical protein DWUX_2322 [Desulfovibrio diazotrophicus]|nr:hypothetical protein DWUX_2322 [Desulfovibrio diazotrophicus]
MQRPRRRSRRSLSQNPDPTRGAQAACGYCQQAPLPDKPEPTEPALADVHAILTTFRVYRLYFTHKK